MDWCFALGLETQPLPDKLEKWCWKMLVTWNVLGSVQHIICIHVCCIYICIYVYLFGKRQTCSQRRIQITILELAQASLQPNKGIQTMLWALLFMPAQAGPCICKNWFKNCFESLLWESLKPESLKPKRFARKPEDKQVYCSCFTPKCWHFWLEKIESHPRFARKPEARKPEAKQVCKEAWRQTSLM